ncbi:TPA: hypothetical protein ACH3X1_014966 [Trebouxia sp. C0004]
MQKTGLQLLPIARLQVNPALACREVQQVVSCLAGDHGAHQISSTASKCKKNMGEADSETTKGVAAGGKSARSPSGAPETPETTSQAPGGDIRPGYDPTGKDKGQQAATQKKQDPSQGKTVGQGDPKKAGPTYTTASAAWQQGSITGQGTFSSLAFAKGPWGQSRSFYSGAVLGFVKDKHDRPDAGSDVGGIQETGSGTGGTNPGLPLDADPLDAHKTERLDDPEELLKRRRAKDPAAFDKVHGKGASFAEETGGKGGGMGDAADKMTNDDASKHLGGRKGKQQTMKTNTKQGAAYTTWARGFFTSATVGADDKAKEAQKTAGNPYAPTSSAGGTPTDNKDDEGHTPELSLHHVWLYLKHMCCSLKPAARALQQTY